MAPRDLFFSAFFMVNIGPPAISPLAFTSRYLTASMHSANLLVRPKQAEIHIQTRAPGPPENIAVATPTILPVPMVAAKAVISVENGETSPWPRFVVRASLPSTLRNAYGRFRQVRKFSLKVRYMPVPTSRVSIAGPHTKLSISLTMALICSIFIIRSFFLFIITGTASGLCLISCRAYRAVTAVLPCINPDPEFPHLDLPILKTQIKTGLRKFIPCRPVNIIVCNTLYNVLLRKRNYRLLPTLSFCLRDWGCALAPSALN